MVHFRSGIWENAEEHGSFSFWAAPTAEKVDGSCFPVWGFVRHRESRYFYSGVQREAEKVDGYFSLGILVRHRESRYFCIGIVVRHRESRYFCLRIVVRHRESRYSCLGIVVRHRESCYLCLGIVVRHRESCYLCS